MAMTETKDPLAPPALKALRALKALPGLKVLPAVPFSRWVTAAS